MGTTRLQDGRRQWVSGRASKSGNSPEGHPGAAQKSSFLLPGPSREWAFITCVVSSVLSANRHGMYFNTDLCKLFANTSLRVPKSLRQLGLRTTNGCPWILVDALLRKTFYDSCRSASMGPTSTDSTTVGGDSSEDSQLHIDLSPIVCSSWAPALFLSTEDCDLGIDGWPLFMHMMLRNWDTNL